MSVPNCKESSYADGKGASDTLAVLRKDLVL